MIYIKEIQLSDGYNQIDGNIYIPPDAKEIIGIGLQPFYMNGNVKTLGGFAYNNGTFSVINSDGDVEFEQKPDDCVFFNNMQIAELLNPVSIKVNKGSTLKVYQQEPASFMLQMPQYVTVYIEYL